MINKKLELLALADEFCINKIKDGYEITFKDSDDCDIEAIIKENDIKYYLSSGYEDDYFEIDMDRLNKLKAFCELMCEENSK